MVAMRGKQGRQGRQARPQVLVVVAVAATFFAVAATFAPQGCEARGLFGMPQRQRMWPSAFPFSEGTADSMFGSLDPFFARRQQQQQQQQFRRQPQSHRQLRQEELQRQQQLREQRQVQEAERTLEQLVRERQNVEAQVQRLQKHDATLREELGHADSAWQQLVTKRQRLAAQRHVPWRQARQLQQEEAYVQRFARERQARLRQIQARRDEMEAALKRLDAAVSEQQAKLDAHRHASTLPQKNAFDAPAQQPREQRVENIQHGLPHQQQHAQEPRSDERWQQRFQQRQRRQQHQEKGKEEQGQQEGQQAPKGQPAQQASAPTQAPQEDRGHSSSASARTRSGHQGEDRGKFVKRVRAADPGFDAASGDGVRERFDRDTGFLVDEDGQLWQAGGIWVGEPGELGESEAASQHRSQDDGVIEVDDDEGEDEDVGAAMREIDAFLTRAR